MEENIIETREVTKSFGGFTAVNSVSFRVAKGQAVGIIGPNGAGKTTFFNLLTGLFPPSSGCVFYKGQEITKATAYERTMLGIIRTFQLVSVFDSLRVSENLVLASVKASRTLAGNGKFFFSPADSRDLWASCLEGLKVMGLEKKAGVMTSELSYGEKRKLEIAMALALHPDVLLLDEPFAGLSDVEINEVIDIIQRVKSRFTFIIIEHKISRLIGLVERLSVMHEGRIIAEDKPERVLCDPLVREVYFGKEEGLVCSV